MARWFFANIRLPFNVQRSRSRWTERDALQHKVFPRLKQLCRSRGLRFQAIDLRWDISEEAGRDTALCASACANYAAASRTVARPE